MFKKIISVVVLTVMVFSLVACNQSTSSSDNELAGYKASALSELEAYTESKGQDNYFDADWGTIMLLFSNAESAIDEAKNAFEIESIVETTKRDIDKVAKKETPKNEEVNNETPNTDANNGMEEISKLFDLSDPTDYWSGTIEDLASGGPYGFPAFNYFIQVTFKKTSEYPILNVEDLNFENAEFISYFLTSPVKDSWFLQYKSLEDFRQIADIGLKERSYEKIMEAIEYLQSLDFVKRAEPAFYDVSDDPVPADPELDYNYIIRDYLKKLLLS